MASFRLWDLYFRIGAAEDVYSVLHATFHSGCELCIASLLPFGMSALRCMNGTAQDVDFVLQALYYSGCALCIAWCVYLSRMCVVSCRHGAVLDVGSRSILRRLRHRHCHPVR